LSTLGPDFAAQTATSAPAHTNHPLFSGLLDELRCRVASGDELAETLILTALLDLGRVDDAVAELRRQIEEDFDNGGGIDPAEQLAELLASHNLVDELKAELLSGNPCAGRWLVKLLTDQGQVEQAHLLQRFGLNPDGTVASPRGAERSMP
jgi:hypothetical protein